MEKRYVVRLLDAGRHVSSKVNTILPSMFPERAVSGFPSPSPLSRLFLLDT